MEKSLQFFFENNFTSLQEEYLKTIITYVLVREEITTDTLVNEYSFDEYDWIDVFGQDFIGVRNYVLKLYESIVVA